MRGPWLMVSCRARPGGAPLDGGQRVIVLDIESVEVPYHLGHVYTECARIWNPIHTDLAVVRAAGLSGPILHGTATLALPHRASWPEDLAGDARPCVGSRRASPAWCFFPST